MSMSNGRPSRSDTLTDQARSSAKKNSPGPPPTNPKRWTDVTQLNNLQGYTTMYCVSALMQYGLNSRGDVYSTLLSQAASCRSVWYGMTWDDETVANTLFVFLIRFAIENAQSGHTLIVCTVFCFRCVFLLFALNQCFCHLKNQQLNIRKRTLSLFVVSLFCEILSQRRMMCRLMER
jgi:hypothetical protein